MSGRGDVDRFEPPRFFRGFVNLGHDIQTAIGGGGAPAHVGLRQSIPTLVPGDPAFAHDLYRGRLKLSSGLLEAGLHRLLATPAYPRINDELLSLAWLSHMAASDLSLYRGFSRNLFKLCSQRRRLSTNVLCRRLMALSRHAGFLLSGCPSDFTGEFFHIISRETRLLKSARPRTAPEDLSQALAMLAVSLAFKGYEDVRTIALERVAHTLPEVILSDGGHITRNPQALLDLLLDLIPLHEASRAACLSVPGSLAIAIGQACAMLRMMCHPDGGLALVQGVDNISCPSIEAVLSKDPHQRPVPRHARQAGYARLDGGKSAVIADVGGNGHYDGTLSFEFSHGSNRIVTNCGTPEMASPAWRAAASSAAAHSGLQLHRPERRRFDFRNLHNRRSPQEVLKADVVDTETGTALIAAALSLSGLVHHRLVSLNSSGQCLEGEDRFTNSGRSGRQTGETRFTMRFHLDPGVKAFSGRSGSAIMLMLPNRGVWQFSAGMAKVGLEDSVVLAGRSGLRHTQQIVIRDTVEQSPKINWAFRRMEKPSRADAPDLDSPGLPF